MIRLFAGYSMCIKVLILLGFSAQLAMTSAYANGGPKMLSIPTQTVVAEQQFTYRIVVDSESQIPIGMRMVNAPKGATLWDNGDSSFELRWTPPADVGETTVVIVQAFNLTQPDLISTQRVVLQRGSAEQIQAAASTIATEVIATEVIAAEAVAAGVNDAARVEVKSNVAAASNKVIGSRLLTRSNSTSTSSSITAAKIALPKTAATLKTPATSEKPAVPTTNAELTTPITPITDKTDVNTTNVTSDTSNTNRIQPAGVEVKANQLIAPANSTETAVNGTVTEDTTAVAAIPDTPASNTESIASSRPELPELGLQSLTVGEDFEFFVRPIVPDNARVQLSAESLPEGASFEDVFDDGSSKMLRWTPTADQVGEHEMVLVLVAEDDTDLSLRTEREVIFDVEPAPPVELPPMLLFEPMSAQIVSAGRKVNIRVDPIVSDEKIALLHVDRLPSGGSFDENKDGTRTFHWPTTQADQGEHTFRFTAIHPENADLVANVDVLIVVGSPDGSGSTGPNVVAAEAAPSSPELDVYPSADSQSPEPYPSADSPSPEIAPSVDSPSPEPYPSADTASPEPLAVKPPPPPRPSP